MRAYYLRLRASRSIGKLAETLERAGCVVLRRHVDALDVLFPADAIEIHEDEEPDEWEERAFAELVSVVSAWAAGEQAKIEVLDERAIEISEGIVDRLRKTG